MADTGKGMDAFRRGDSSPETDDVGELTEQFYVTLRASLSRIVGTAAADKTNIERIQNLLEQVPPTWSGAYEIEQLLVSLYDDETVQTELAVRLLEARGLLSEPLSRQYEGAAKVATDRHRRRAVLARLINDLQWRYTVNAARRRYAKAITTQAGVLFLGTLISFGAVMGVTVLLGIQLAYGDLRLFGVAGVSGAWGASFSILSTLRTRLDVSKLDDLRMMRPRVMLIARALIGAGGACILYLFLLSGLLSGAMFPKLSFEGVTATATIGATLVAPPPADVSAGTSALESGPPSDTGTGPDRPPHLPTGLPNSQLALLIVWCFIAGFSEQLVPGLLNRTEARGNERAEPIADRSRPAPIASTPLEHAIPPVPATGSGTADGKLRTDVPASNPRRADSSG